MLANSPPSSPKCTTRSDERGRSFRYARPDRAVPLFGHRQLLAQALSNLIENAIRYGADDTAGGEVIVTVEPGEKKIRIAVADRGPGIPLARREEALRRFGRLDFEPLR